MPDEVKELTLHPDRHGLQMLLGDLEAEIMNVIWREPAGSWCTVRDVYETLRLERQIAYTTVMNTMTRLAKKGLLESRKQEQAYTYRPRESRELFVERIVGHVLERLLLQFTAPTEAALAVPAAQNGSAAERIAWLHDELNQRRASRPAQPPQASRD